MDNLTDLQTALMPPKAPLPMAEQAFFRAPPRRLPARRMTASDIAWRIAAFGPAVALTAWLCSAIAHWLAAGGVTALEVAIVALIGLTFIWVSLSVSTVTLGIVRRVVSPRADRPKRPTAGPQSIALLVPIYNEVPSDVFGNASAILKDLAHGHQTDRFTLFILSDTRDPDIATDERRAYFALRTDAPDGIAVHYRRRPMNTDKKVGNLSDWIENWGAAYDAMVVLDADSLMSGTAIRQLATALANDPDAGLIQSFPSVVGAETLFGRIQQFSNTVYGWLLAEGLSVWSQRESNYWGHNAIIRIRAFADSARLPHLTGPRGRKSLILSHDFVEAGMLRRAGWGVRFLPRVGGSFEEVPQTLIDYALRDRRWCQGNLQHLLLIGARGFHPVSRFHLLQGALAFLMSPAWFALILIWSLVGSMPVETTSYFSAANPLYPIWPVDQSVGGLVYLAVIYGMLLVPKLTATVALGLRRRVRMDYGGWLPYLGSAAFEIFCAILYAPILMVQQSIAVAQALLGRSGRWGAQNRHGDGYSWGQTLRFHWVETAIGLGMGTGIAIGAMSPWLLPIALSLITSVPLSKLSGWKIGPRVPKPFRLESPISLREPRVVRVARSEKAWMKDMLAKSAQPMAAE